MTCSSLIPRNSQTQSLAATHIRQRVVNRQVAHGRIHGCQGSLIPVPVPVAVPRC